MTDKSKTPSRIGTQGWQQFLMAKKEMLSHFDRAKKYAEAHEVQVYHGIVAEEQFRTWLLNYLPKRYSVTSGYVISQGQKDDVKAPHFDVIVYDCLNSPVLWVEDHSGLSISGRSQAIPAEYVFAVLEIKSQFNSSTVKKGLEHLLDLEPLYRSIDKPDERYKKFLPNNFVCGLVFFELLDKEKYATTAFDNLIIDNMPRNYFGGLILRGEGLNEDHSGQISILSSDSAMTSIIEKPNLSLLTGFQFSNSKKFGNKHLAAGLNWNENNFSGFANDLVSMMAGTYRSGFASSMHGMSWMNLERPKN